MFSIMFLAVIGAGAAGCGPQEKPKALIRGAVTLNGTPLKEGAIKFIPIAGDGPTTGAVIKPEGDYSVAVPAGMMRVEITSSKVTGKRKAYDTPDSPLIEITEEQIPAKFNSNSELKYEVASGEKEIDVDFDLLTDSK
jgi:hypothetical protein